MSLQPENSTPDDGLLVSLGNCANVPPLHPEPYGTNDEVPVDDGWNETMAEIFADKYSYMCNYVGSLLRGSAMGGSSAEDIASDAIVNVYKTRGRGVGIQTANGYFRTTAYHCVVNATRKPDAHTQAMPEDYEEHSPSFEPRVLNSQVLQELLAATELSPLHLAILDLMYFQGRTTSEAARELNMPVGTVKSSKFYALKCIRRTAERLGLSASDFGG